jgi:NTE family protein
MRRPLLSRFRFRRWLLVALALAVAGCASRPINPPLEQSHPANGYRFEVRGKFDLDKQTLVILAFSGGGTRAAAFSYGVLEELRRTEVDIAGKRVRLLDEVDLITGVSGGSFTALAYALHGEKLFDNYEQSFLKRNVQGELLARTLSPGNWSALWSDGWGRSEMAAQLYDEILFGNATFGDLMTRPGPTAMVTATDISTGSRLTFTQGDFDLICSDIAKVPLSRAAAASSAVPLVLSPVTINNYGGSCGYRKPRWMRALEDPNNPSRPAGRALQRFKELDSFQDGVNRPYLHLVDGGLADNLCVRGVLEALEQVEASEAMRNSPILHSLKRIVVVVVNSLSVPETDWDRRERPPSDLVILLKATGVPIDRYSYEAVELLKDIIARWKTFRQLRAAGSFAGGGHPVLSQIGSVPDIDIFPIDVSFSALSDADERRFLNDLPTSFVLMPDQVDRLRAAAGRIIRESPDFKRLLVDIQGAVVPPPPPLPLPAAAPAARR